MWPIEKNNIRMHNVSRDSVEEGNEDGSHDSRKWMETICIHLLSINSTVSNFPSSCGGLTPSNLSSSQSACTEKRGCC